MLEKCKEDARRVIARRQLCSYMNQTKWREMIDTIKTEMPVPPSLPVSIPDFPGTHRY